MITPAGTGTPAARPMGLAGAGGEPRESHTYYVLRGDGKWKLRTARIPVPVDNHGAASHARFYCPRRCKTYEWVPLSVADKAAANGATPTCKRCHFRMQRVGIPHATWLPYQAVLAAVFPYLWPPAALVVTAALGAGAHAGQVHPAAVAVLGGFAAWAAGRWFRHRLVGRAQARGATLQGEDGEGRRLREKIAKDGRAVSYAVALATVWAVYATAVGVDPTTVAGVWAWPFLLILWIGPAATWWRHTRTTLAIRPEPEPVRDEGPVDDRDPDLAYVEWLIQTSLVQTAGDDVPANPPPVRVTG